MCVGGGGGRGGGLHHVHLLFCKSVYYFDKFAATTVVPKLETL